VVTRTTESSVKAGDQANVVGFGWTNAAFAVLLHALPRRTQKDLIGISRASKRLPVRSRVSLSDLRCLSPFRVGFRLARSN
jgi:hypothetical protein